MTGQFSDQFRLSITRALGDQLAEALDKLTPAPLTQANLDELDERAKVEKLQSRSGVYQLHHGPDRKLVYVGKADKPLSSRLGNHLRKISGRRNISIDEMTFKCLYVAEDFSAVAPEKLLIKKYKASGHIPWNANGFGNKDPGRNRDRTVLKANHFDMLFPIDLGRAVEGLTPGEQSLFDLLQRIKQGLPYNFRYMESAHFKKVAIALPDSDITADGVFELVAKALPDSWQISALMGYTIMYDDRHTDYASAWRYYRGDEVLEAQPAAKAADDADEDSEDDEDDEL
ncbi:MULTISPECIES: Eco29kI family restriction endonuclease [unclassified Streptomyces]|uniref:Eco29kI family restriction endonuclease n=1 Tax=unclassified Streptomyces TaxID=2593676 RepID=UPI00226E2CFD|nr:Eco29kI family restriction endonuclease [Streptomyces sp. H27-H5]MCY0958521.1 Eco29kI family restriction endonuclease [Streptomyces sp. H27-H5]